MINDLVNLQCLGNPETSIATSFAITLDNGTQSPFLVNFYAPSPLTTSAPWIIQTFLNLSGDSFEVQGMIANLNVGFEVQVESSPLTGTISVNPALSVDVTLTSQGTGDIFTLPAGETSQSFGLKVADLADATKRDLVRQLTPDAGKSGS
jgi:hypothetical protein